MLVDVQSSDHLVNKTRLAREIGVSVVTVGNWIERFDDFPIRSRGTNGREYRFDLGEVVTFLRQRKDEETRLESERDATLAQLVLPLVGEQAPAATATAKVPIKEQIEALRLSTMRRAEMERLGQLVPAEEVKAALTDAMSALARALRAAVRSMGHDHNLPPQVVRALEAKMADAQRGFVRDAASFLAPENMLIEPLERAHG